MPKYKVEFQIDAPSLGDATNRALVALYKGGLDAEKVSVEPVEVDKYRTYGEETPEPEKFNLRTPAEYSPKPVIGPPPGFASGGYVMPVVPERYQPSPSEAAVQEVRDAVQKARKLIPKEPHKDALD